MIASRFWSNESQLPASGPSVRGPQQEENLYDTFLTMRDLLEEYAPVWYSDDLHKRVQAVVQSMDK